MLVSSDSNPMGSFIHDTRSSDGMELAIVSRLPNPWKPNSPVSAYFGESPVPPYEISTRYFQHASIQPYSPPSTNFSTGGSRGEDNTVKKHKPMYCALREISDRINNPSDLSTHHWKYRQSLFLRWVAYERLYDQSIIYQERLRCPLLWCRQLFDSPGTLLKHVEGCDRLVEGEYWCHEHATPERFASPIASRRKSSLKLSVCLRHAVRIIRRLGSRRPRKTQAVELEAQVLQPLQPLPTDHLFALAPQRVSSKRQDVELSTQSCEVKELSAVRSQYYELQTASDLATNQPDLPRHSDEAMEVDESNDSSSVSYRSISPIDEGYHVVDGDLLSPMSPRHAPPPLFSAAFCRTDDALGHNLSCPNFLPAAMPVEDFHSSPILISAMDSIASSPFGLHFDTCMTIDSDFDAVTEPMNAQAGLPSMIVYSEEKILCAVDYDSEAHRHTTSKHLPDQFVNHQDPVTADNEQEKEVDPGAERQMRTQLELVENLRQVSKILYKRSVRNLCRDQMTADIQSFMEVMPSCMQIIEKGLAALRKFFAGNLPNDLMEIYSMLHVVYVVAIVINQNEVIEIQKDLYADILNWSLAIKSDRERAFFVDIARRIWASDYTKEYCPRSALVDAPGILNQSCFTSVLPAIHEAQRSPSNGSTKFGIFTAPRNRVSPADSLFQTLKNGTAIYLCRQYLDILEYTGLLSDPRESRLRQMRGCLPRALPIQEANIALQWQDNITAPLIEFVGLEGFRSIIINVQQLISNGALHSVREIELKLAYDGQHCSRSPSKYHNFLREIRRLCKDATVSPLQPPFSHDVQYIRDIDATWHLLHKLNLKNEQHPTPTPTTSGCARMTNKDLPPLRTDSCTMTIASDNIKASSSSSTSPHTIPSGCSGETVFSSISAISSTSSSSSLLVTPPRSKATSRTPSTSTSASSPNSLTPFSTPQSNRRPSRASASNSSSPSTGIVPLYCSQCHEPFTGNYQKTNLARHIKSVHVKGKRLPCPRNGCGETFTRSDNLKTHQRKFEHW